jgi:hypothetical protein
MNVPARKPDSSLKVRSASNLPSLLRKAPEAAYVPTLDTHELFSGSVDDLDSWSLPALLITGFAALVLGASTYIALVMKHVDVPAPTAVAVPVAAAKTTPALEQTEKSLAGFTQGLKQLSALYPEAGLTVEQKGHKGVVIGVSESFFFSSSHVQLQTSTGPFFDSLRDLAAASGLRFNVAVETSTVVASDGGANADSRAREDYLRQAKRALSFSNAFKGDTFLQKRVRTTLQTGSTTSTSRLSLKLAVSRNT